MSFLRRQKRATKRDNRYQHLLKVQSMCKQMIDSKVLQVWPAEKKAAFPGQIWKSKDMDFKTNAVKNIALYILAENSQDPEAEMEVDLFDFDMNLMASYKNKKVTVFI